MKGKVKQADKFRTIHGIGQAREKWLQAKFKVYTFGALASLAADEIERELGDAPTAIARGIERGDIEAWLEEAHQLTAQNSDKKMAPQADKQSGADGNKDVRFFVEFQTRTGQTGKPQKQTKVHEMETGKENVWPEHTLDEPTKWMWGWIEQEANSQTEEFVPTIEPDKAVLKPPPVKPTVVFEIIQVSIFQPQSAVGEAGIGLPDTVFNGTLLGDVPFKLECHLAAGLEENEDDFDGTLPYCLELFATDRETGKVVTLGSVDGVADKTGLQKVVITEACLAGGVYRVEAIVTSSDFPCKPGFMEIPLLRTV